MPNIALIGYGNMGKELEQTAKAKGITINAIVDVNLTGHTSTLNAAVLEHVNVCIDFTTPDAVLENIRICAALKKNLVIGTTGWLHHTEEVKAIVHENNIGLIHASNFSIGVHLFLLLVREAGALISAFEQYDVAIMETHHNQKKDSPSGTALSLAHALLESVPWKQKIVIERPERQVQKDELQIASLRVGSVPGTHAVLFDSNADTIELRHTARNRRGFAEGALLAAQWIQNKKGFFSLEDMLDDYKTI